MVNIDKMAIMAIMAWLYMAMNMAAAVQTMAAFASQIISRQNMQNFHRVGCTV